MEALDIAADWTYPVQISRTPIYAYGLVLLFDFLIYSFMAAVVIDAHHKTDTPTISQYIKKEKPNIKEADEQRNNDSNNSTNNRRNKSSSRFFTIFFQSVGSRGLWTLQILGSAFSYIFQEIFNGLGYFWGRDVHTYTSLQQHQQQQQNNIDTYNSMTFKSRMEGSKSYDDFDRKRNSTKKKLSVNSHSKSFSSRSTPRSSSYHLEIPKEYSFNQVDEISSQKELERIYNKIPSHESETNKHDNMIKVDEQIVKNGNYVNKVIDESNAYEGDSDCKENEEEECENIDSPRSTQTCMKIIDVSKEYSTGVVILHRVCAELRQGTVTCLLGIQPFKN